MKTPEQLQLDFSARQKTVVLAQVKPESAKVFSLEAMRRARSLTTVTQAYAAIHESIKHINVLRRTMTPGPDLSVR